jgi:alcohol dehydrogenase class IV
MAYPIGGMKRDYRPDGYLVDGPMIPHGQTVAVTAPAAFKLTAPIWPEKHAHAAELLGLNSRGMSVREAALALPDQIIQLMKDIGFPNGLNELGYTEADIPQIVEGTLKQERLMVGCPLVTGEKELTQIAKESMKIW